MSMMSMMIAALAMRRRAGFTLVEMLVALAVFGLLAGLIASLLGLGVVTRERLAAGAGGPAREAQFIFTLSSLARQALPLTRIEDRRPVHAFSYRPDRLRFGTVTGCAGYADALCVIRLRHDPGAAALWLEQCLHPCSDEAWIARARLDDIAGLEIEMLSGEAVWPFDLRLVITRMDGTSMPDIRLSPRTESWLR